MNTNRRHVRWAGVFYIISTGAPILTLPFIGFLGGGVAGGAIPDYLVHVSTNKSQVIVGMLIELTWALSVVGIIVTLFPILKNHNETLSLGVLWSQVNGGHQQYDSQPPSAIPGNIKSGIWSRGISRYCLFSNRRYIIFRSP